MLFAESIVQSVYLLSTYSVPAAGVRALGVNSQVPVPGADTLVRETDGTHGDVSVHKMTPETRTRTQCEWGGVLLWQPLGRGQNLAP